MWSRRAKSIEKAQSRIIGGNCELDERPNFACVQCKLFACAQRAHRSCCKQCAQRNWLSVVLVVSLVGAFHHLEAGGEQPEVPM